MSARGDKRDKLLSRGVQLGFVIGLIALWYFGTAVWGINQILLPNPINVWHELEDVIRTGEFLPDLQVTLTEVAVAFVLSCTSGVTLGYLISRSHYSIRVFEPLLAGAYSVPIILFLPLYVLFFGLGPWSKIALGTTISFFPIALNTIAGFGYVDRIFITAARSMGASDFQMFRYVLLPAALPVILTGLRIGFTVALLSILGSETIASLAGLGHRIVHLAEAMETPRMFAYIAFAVVIAALLNTVVTSLEQRARRR
ncbi:MAG: ABC transporter permease [Xanthobacteraceae bacterium]